MAFKDSKEGLKHLSEAQEVLKVQLNSVISINHDLTEQVKQLSLLKHDLEEVTIAHNEAEDTIADLEDQLEVVIESHAATTHKLQTATLILQVGNPCLLCPKDFHRTL